MLGNVWEWCHDGPDREDEPHPYPTTTTEARPLIDHAKGGTIFEGTHRILRGGAFDYSPRQARAAYRYAVAASHRRGHVRLPGRPHAPSHRETETVTRKASLEPGLSLT